MDKNKTLGQLLEETTDEFNRLDAEYKASQEDMDIRREKNQRLFLKLDRTKGLLAFLKDIITKE